MIVARSTRTARLAAAAVIVAATAGTGSLASHSAASADDVPQSFHLRADYTQSIYGLGPSQLGGVAFTPSGDAVSDLCSAATDLIRWEPPTTVVHGTTIHEYVDEPSDAGCGLAQGAGGDIYSNTYDGVTDLDGESGALDYGPGADQGNGDGIVVDPVTGDLIYIASDADVDFSQQAADGRLLSTDSSLDAAPTDWSDALAGKDIDGLSIDPTGSYVVAAVRGVDDPPGDYQQLNQLVFISTATRQIVQTVTLADGSQPDGTLWHQRGSTLYLISNNNDGTINRVDFPNGVTGTPSVSTIASGGYRGDLLAAGPDGCAYVTQDGTTFNDGTVLDAETDTTDSDYDSLVRICDTSDASSGGGFVPAPGPLPSTNGSDALACHLPDGTILANGSHVPLGSMVDCTASRSATWLGDHLTPGGTGSSTSQVFTAARTGHGGIEATTSSSHLELRVVVDPAGPTPALSEGPVLFLPAAAAVIGGAVLLMPRRRRRAGAGR